MLFVIKTNLKQHPASFLAIEALKSPISVACESRDLRGWGRCLRAYRRVRGPWGSPGGCALPQLGPV